MSSDEDNLQFDDEFSRLVAGINAASTLVRRRQKIREALSLRRGECVLDFGSGPGHLLAEMSPLVGPEGQVHGIDASESMIAMSKKRCTGHDNVTHHIGDAMKMSFEDGYFDAVVSSQVFEYLADVPAALAKVNRVLKPGGRVVLHDSDWGTFVWNSTNPDRMRRFRDLWDRHLCDPHLPQTLGGKLLDAGFAVARTDVHAILETDCNPDSAAHYMIKFVARYLASQDVSQYEIDEWAADLEQLGAAGRFFYNHCEYIFVGVKK